MLYRDEPGSQNHISAIGDTAMWKKYKFIANTAKEFMTLINEDYVYEFVNEAYCKAHSKPLKDIIDHSVIDVWGEERFQIDIKHNLDKCFAGNEVHYQGWFEFSALGMRYFDVTYCPYYNQTGVVTHAVVVSHDMTEHKQAENALKKYRDHLESLLAAQTLDLRETNNQLNREIIERKEAEKKVVALNYKLLSLQYTGAAIAASLDIQFVLNTVTQEMIALLNVEGCVISEWNQGTDTISAIAQYATLNWQNGDGLRQVNYLADFPLTKQVLASRRAQQISINQPDISATELTFLQKANIKTLLILPMESHDRVVGSIQMIGGLHEQTFSLEDIGLAQLLANQTASAIQNARLYAETERRLIEQTALREAGLVFSSTLNLTTVLDYIAEQMGRAVDATSVYIYSYYAQSMTSTLLTRYFGPRASSREQAANPGDSHKLPQVIPYDFDLLQNGQPEIIHQDAPHANGLRDYMQQIGAQTILKIPLQIDRRIIAFAELWESRRRREFTREEIALCQSIAQQAAIALENARLYERTRQEIVERKRAEEAMRKLSRAVEQSPVSIIITDTKGRIEYVNPKFTQLTGYSFEEVTGNNPRILKSGQMPPEVYECLWDTITGGKEWQEELQNKKKNGTLFWVSAVISPIFDYNGSISHFVAVEEDITERKKLTDTLAKSEARLLAEMKSVLVINRALVSELKLDKLLEFIITQAQALMDADGAFILLLSGDKKFFDVATIGFSHLQIETSHRFQVQGSPAEQAMSSQQIQVFNNGPSEHYLKSISAFLPQANIHSLLCAPLKAQNKALGALLTWSEQEENFGPNDCRLMDLFADQVALAIYNAELYARNRRLAIEQERHRLARELHDTVTQSLYSIAMAAKTSLKLLRQAEPEDRLQYPLEHISMLAKNALTEVREQIYHLSPTSLVEKGLVEALTHHCNLLKQRYSIAIEIAAASEISLSMDQQEVLYYIAREALWNIIKHAEATSIDIALTDMNNHIALSIVDNGIGFDPSEVLSTETMGLKNMQERIGSLGGAFELQSKPGEGTRISVRIPRHTLTQLSIR